jgi:hypothetical protein
MWDIFLLSLVAAANASLLAAVTVMLFLPSPKRLLLGYLAGGMLVSLAVGFVVVFVVHNASSTETARNAVSPSIDIVLGLVFGFVAYLLAAGHDQQVKERRAQKHAAAGDEPTEKGPSKVEQLLGRGSARVTFALGDLAALHDLQELGYSAAGKVLVIIGFNIMLLLLIEIPLVGYFVAPERTVVEVQRFRSWLSRRGRRMAVVAFAVIAVFLLARGVVGYLT